MSALPERRHLFGVPVEEYPNPCSTCTVLAEFALLLENPDLTKQPHYLHSDSNRYRMVARMVFPYLDRCSTVNCGINEAYALQHESNLE